MHVFVCVLQTNARSDYLDAEYKVNRRYNDFAWLRDRMEQSYPMCLLPVSVVCLYGGDLLMLLINYYH